MLDPGVTMNCSVAKTMTMLLCYLFLFRAFLRLFTFVFVQVCAGMSLDASADVDMGFDVFRSWWQRHTAKTWSAGSSHLVLFLVCALPTHQVVCSELNLYTRS